MSDVNDNGGLTLPYPTVFLFYDGEEPEYYTALTGENLNRPLKQIMANIKALQTAIASGGVLNSKMSLASDNKARALAPEKSYPVVDYDYATLAKNPNIDVSRADETNQTIRLCKGETTSAALNLVAHLKFYGVKSAAETLIKFHNLSTAGSQPMTIEIGSTAIFYEDEEPDNYRKYPVTFPQFSLPPKITLQPNEYATLRCILNSGSATRQPTSYNTYYPTLAEHEAFVAIEVSFGTF